MDKIKRPKETHGETIRLKTGCGDIYVTLGKIDGTEQLIEVFATLGKSGACPRAQTEALTRSISLGLKYGIPLKEYVDEFIGIGCPNPSFDDGIEVMSCPDAIGKILKRFIEPENKKEV